MVILGGVIGGLVAIDVLHWATVGDVVLGRNVVALLNTAGVGNCLHRLAVCGEIP